MTSLLHLKENTVLIDKYFPINIFHKSVTSHNVLHIHWHEYLELIYMVEGHAIFNIGSQAVEAIPGDILFVNSGQIHSGCSIDKLPVSYYAIVFDKSILSSQSPDPVHIKYIAPFIEGRYIFPYKIAVTDEKQSVFELYIQNLINEFKEKKPGYELIIKSFLSVLTISAFRYYCPQENIKNNRKFYENNVENFKKLIMYVEQNYNKKISIGQAARIVNLSPFHFCKTFKRITGRTFIEFLNLYRINEAEKYLMNTELTITEIAEKSGFCNVNYFDKIFKQYKKYSPSKCRT
jgi:AraC-type DNA-binding domain-containing proteins